MYYLTFHLRLLVRGQKAIGKWMMLSRCTGCYTSLYAAVAAQRNPRAALPRRCSYLATWWDIGFHFPYLKGTFFKNLHFNGTVPFTLIRCEHLQIDTEFSFFVCLFFPYFPFRSVYTKNHKKYFVPFKNVFLSPNKRCWFCLFGKTVCLVRRSVWVYRKSVWVVCWEYYTGCLFS